MYGAILGDIIGSKYEFDNIRTKCFPLFSPGCSYTDDTLMTLAIGKALLRARKENKSFRLLAVEEMQRIGRAYPYPQGGYGGRFAGWLCSEDPRPYHSYGNGSAMRVSACARIAQNMSQAMALAKASAEVTHDHPEGIMGAQAVAAAIRLAMEGKQKEDIGNYIQLHFYPMDRTLDQIRPGYGFDESCQGTVPEAIQAFLESESFEDAIRNAISLGGDSDTIGAITGAIAWAYYEDKEDLTALREIALSYLPAELRVIVTQFELERAGAAPIPL